MLKHFGNYQIPQDMLENTRVQMDQMADAAWSKSITIQFQQVQLWFNQTPAFILSTKTYFRPEHDTASEAETVKEWTLSEHRLTINKVGRWKDSLQQMKRVEVEHRRGSAREKH